MMYCTSISFDICNKMSTKIAICNVDYKFDVYPHNILQEFIVADEIDGYSFL